MITGKGPFVDSLVSGGGKWCWNDAIGCVQQLKVLSYLGILIALVAIAIFIDNVRRK